MSVWKKILKELTPERIEEMKQERIKHNKQQTLEFQLGYYVGEFIVDNHLPTLSTDMMKSRKCIIVSEEDTKENKRLNDEWYSSTRYGDKYNGKDESGDKEKWEELRNHSKILEYKYLPHNLVCHLSPINVGNIEEFKKGLSWSLWDCDMCSYSIKPENIKIYDDEDGFFTTIELVLGQIVGE